MINVDVLCILWLVVSVCARATFVYSSARAWRPTECHPCPVVARWCLNLGATSSTAKPTIVQKAMSTIRKTQLTLQETSNQGIGSPRATPVTKATSRPTITYLGRITSRAPTFRHAIQSSLRLNRLYLHLRARAHVFKPMRGFVLWYKAK